MNPARSVIILISLLLVPSTAFAQKFTNFSSGLDEVAKQIVHHIRTTPQLQGLRQEIVIGDFTSAIARHRATGGPAIVHGLTKSLTTLGFQVTEDGPFQLTGKFTLIEEPDSPNDTFDSAVLKISVTLGDARGNDLKIFSTRITESSSPLIIAGATASFPVLTSVERQQEIAIQAIEKPAASITEQKTRAEQDSPFAVEILRRQSDGTLESLKATAESGRSTVTVGKDDTLVVRLHNEAPFEVAVRLTIDGIDWDGFAEDQLSGRMHLVSPDQSLDVTSWFLAAGNTPTFKVTEFPESAAALKGQQNSTRTITALFHACWETDGQRPDDEFRARSIGTQSAAVGFGESDNKSFQEARRTVGRLRSVVSVRYRNAK